MQAVITHLHFPHERNGKESRRKRSKSQEKGEMKINDDEDNDNNDVRVINEASVSGNSFVLHEGEKKKKKRGNRKSGKRKRGKRKRERESRVYIKTIA